MSPTHDTYTMSPTQQSPTQSIDQHTVDMSDSMALAYADHSVARKHLCADQNVARTRCEYMQLQGCIVSMRDVC